ncbi:MAG: DUF4301 family protein [Bacteroidales bacterium]|nr:DUF4301 family protein [Bacteroidales bacterium]MDD4603128.1 DUF4301 family protein [Bacteroidales bacterium]
MYTDLDLEQIKQHGITLKTIEKQISHFKHGFPFIKLIRPAIPGDGILSYSENEKEIFIRYFEDHFLLIHVTKFVPASGAASRMFKQLFEFREHYNNNANGLSLFESNQEFDSPYYFLAHLSEIAFYDDLRKNLSSNGQSLEMLLKKKDFNTIIDFILTKKGLDYANLPKGLIIFHKDSEGTRTSIEEHLVEAAMYTRDQHDIAHIHFTVSPEHKKKFKELLNSVKSKYESKYGVRFDFSFSIQSPSTDTLAVDINNEPFRDLQKKLVFRPGGHGALLSNLNEIDADLIFIKNIDNVVPDKLKLQTFRHKKLLGGVLLTLQHEIYKYLTILEQNTVTRFQIEEMFRFLRKQLCIPLSVEFQSLEISEQSKQLFNLLNRPIRVCGMVKNEGEPGGGPFWVLTGNRKETLQIVESSQIDIKDPGQKSILQNSTYFNPVDLVCGIKDYRGNSFDLTKFIDEETGFISIKSLFGKSLKAQELPGLWNGAMSDWITLFVEIPIITFNPVKSVNDLLRKEHVEF